MQPFFCVSFLCLWMVGQGSASASQGIWSRLLGIAGDGSKIMAGFWKVLQTGTGISWDRCAQAAPPTFDASELSSSFWGQINSKIRQKNLKPDLKYRFMFIFIVIYILNINKHTHSCVFIYTPININILYKYKYVSICVCYIGEHIVPYREG